jgi:UDP-N-acetylmuramate-alanine ligase
VIVEESPVGETAAIHLIGVCGTAMATLAALLKQRGYDVRDPIRTSIRR